MQCQGKVTIDFGDKFWMLMTTMFGGNIEKCQQFSSVCHQNFVTILLGYQCWNINVFEISPNDVQSNFRPLFVLKFLFLSLIGPDFRAPIGSYQ